jgi:hypothetical protein
MTPATLPPLISSDGHLEVVPERWTGRMPARLRDRAPRTIKLPDGGDAILDEGQKPYPVPFHFPHIECDWPNTRPFAARLVAGVPGDEAFLIAAGNVLRYFRLEATPMGQKVRAAAAA